MLVRLSSDRNRRRVLQKSHNPGGSVEKWYQNLGLRRSDERLPAIEVQDSTGEVVIVFRPVFPEATPWYTVTMKILKHVRL